MLIRSNQFCKLDRKYQSGLQFAKYLISLDFIKQYMLLFNGNIQQYLHTVCSIK